MQVLMFKVKINEVRRGNKLKTVFQGKRSKGFERYEDVRLFHDDASVAWIGEHRFAAVWSEEGEH